jgi:hypothetical protein
MCFGRIVAGMTDWSTRRTAMLTALESSMGAELIGVFDELLPDRPWRESIPAEHWYRADVRDAVAAHSRERRHLQESLVEVVGETHAGTLMAYLVPAPWTVLDGLGVPVADLVDTPNAA